ncbi:hypothetical protein MYA_3201 [Burkholderia sp. KJ006]|nr:hypothetical protein MYA_3201 [Burkholderia sp. KJ006]
MRPEALARGGAGVGNRLGMRWGMDRGLQDVSPDVGMPAWLRGIVCRL